MLNGPITTTTVLAYTVSLTNEVLTVRLTLVVEGTLSVQAIDRLRHTLFDAVETALGNFVQAGHA